MNIFRFFRTAIEPKAAARPAAQQARERLQVVLAHERAYATAPDYVPQLQNEILQVISRYVEFDPNKLLVNLQHTGTVSRLEVDIELPNSPCRPLRSDDAATIVPAGASNEAPPVVVSTESNGRKATTRRRRRKAGEESPEPKIGPAHAAGAASSQA